MRPILALAAMLAVIPCCAASAVRCPTNDAGVPPDAPPSGQLSSDVACATLHAIYAAHEGAHLYRIEDADIIAICPWPEGRVCFAPPVTACLASLAAARSANEYVAALTYCDATACGEW